MRIALCHDWRLVSQEALDLVEIDPGLHQPRGEGMPQIMKMEILDTDQLQRSTKGSAEMTVVKKGIRVTREHVVTLDRPYLGFYLQDIEHETVDRNGSPFPVL